VQRGDTGGSAGRRYGVQQIAGLHRWRLFMRCHVFSNALRRSAAQNLRRRHDNHIGDSAFVLSAAEAVS
jgi:hypothetical protein